MNSTHRADSSVLPRSVSWLYAFTTLVVAACEQAQAPVAPDVSQPRMMVHEQRSVGIGSDDRRAGWVDQVPGFAGAFMEHGRLVVRVTEAAGPDAAIKSGMRTLLTGGASSGTAADAAHMLVDRVEVRRGATFDFRQLQTWRASIRRHVFGTLGVDRLSVSDRGNQIIVGTFAADKLPDVRAQVENLGVPAGAFRVVLSGGPVRSEAGLDDAVLPRIAGLHVWLQSTWGTGCTLGYNATRPGTNNRYLLTASHCLPPIGSMQGSALGQPLTTSNTVGYEVSDPSTFTGGDCPQNQTCRYSDVVLVQYYSGASSRTGRLAWPWTIGSTSYWDVAHISTTAAIYEGDYVDLVGQASGRRAGEITDDCTDISDVNNITYPCMIQADYYSQSGDSGAPVTVFRFPYLVTYRFAAGVHKGEDGAGNRYASNVYIAIEEISDDLGLSGSDSLCISIACDPPVLTVEISGPLEVPPYVQEGCAWESSVSNADPYGTVTYEWKWDSQVVSTDPSYASDPTGGTGLHLLKLTVHDGTDSATDQVVVDVDYSHSCW